MKEGVFYHLGVRSFADSLPDAGVGALAGDGIGDLPGLTARLDYISSLGVTGIMLMPIFVNRYPESGGYLTIDHLHVAPEFGGDAAWTAFIAAAHARNLKVVLDLSFSLVSTDHPWFVSAQSSPQSPDRARFIRTRMDGGVCPFAPNQSVLPDGGPTNGWTPFDAGPGDLECRWCDYATSICSAPDVGDAVVRQYFLDVARTWLQRGADGFRLDSAQSLAQVTAQNPTVKNVSAPLTHDFWRVFMREAKTQRPEAFALAELLDPTGYFDDGIDLGTDYLTWLGFVWSWQNGLAKSGAPLNKGLGELLPYQIVLRPPGAWGAGFLGNHDAPGHDFFGYGSGRIADLLCPSPCTDLSPLRAAALFQFALPATPFVYAGEELGLHGAPGLDGRRWSRNPMHWDASPGRGFSTGTPWTPLSSDVANVASQQGVGGSMLETYRALISKRKSSAALSRGQFLAIPASNPAVFAFVRSAPSERVLVLTNFGNSIAQTTVDLSLVPSSPGAVTEYLFGSSVGALTAQNLTAYPVALQPKSTLWLRLP